MLRTDSWASITKSMETWEQDRGRESQGLTARINWKDKDRLEEVNEMARKGMKENPDTWYNPTPYSSESLRHDSNVIKPYKIWALDNNIKNPPTKIVNYVYFSSKDAKTQWGKERGNEEMIYDWCNDNPNREISYIPLHEFEEDILIGK